MAKMFTEKRQLMRVVTKIVHEKMADDHIA